MVSDFDDPNGYKELEVPEPNFYPSDRIPITKSEEETKRLLFNKEIEQHEIDDMQRRQRAYEIARQLIIETTQEKDARGYTKRQISIKEQLEEERKLAKFMLGDEY